MNGFGLCVSVLSVKGHSETREPHNNSHQNTSIVISYEGFEWSTSPKSSLTNAFNVNLKLVNLDLLQEFHSDPQFLQIINCSEFKSILSSNFFKKRTPGNSKCQNLLTLRALRIHIPIVNLNCNLFRQKRHNIFPTFTFWAPELFYFVIWFEWVDLWVVLKCFVRKPWCGRWFLWWSVLMDFEIPLTLICSWSEVSEGDKGPLRTPFGKWVPLLGRIPLFP